MNQRLAIAAMTALALAAGVAQAQTGASAPKQKGSVTLESSVAGVIPGQPFDVALSFTLTESWHIYWQNSGESGLPPRVKWDLPDGFVVGDIRFPVPKRLKDAAGVTTNILEGSPVLVATVTPPDSISSQKVVISGKVKYLICAGSCLREEADVSLELPVQAVGSTAKPANDDLFSRARRALPKQASKYLSVEPKLDKAELFAGKSFELQVKIDIKRGFHIQSHTPLNAAFIKCDVFLERIPDVFYKDATYPEPHFRTIKYLGKVSEYAGKIVVRIPGLVDGEATSGTVRLGGLVKYQACNNKGTCFPPEAVAFSLSVPVKGSTKVGSAIDAQPGGQDAVSQELLPERQAATPTFATTDDQEEAGAGGLEAFLESLGLPGLLAMCFVYGLLINATPCVLPLLSIKVLSFVQQAHESRRRTMILGLSFGLGVMILFVALGLLASRGGNLLQYPVAVIALGTIVMAMSLSMLGVFTLQVPTAATNLEASIQKEGVLASFGKGMLAPVLGFACTGPLMAGALAWATRQEPSLAITAFIVMGFGMAFPYMLLGANPKWLSFLPKPGNWMITFERLMGFLLLGLVVLLIHPIAAKWGTSGLEWTLVFMVTVAMACWIWGKVDFSMTAAQRFSYRGGAGALVAVSALVIYGWLFQPEDVLAGGGHSGLIAWRTWSPDAVKDAVDDGHTVFVDFTASYCTNCKINKKRAINTEATRERMEALGVIPFRADFSDGDPSIFAELQKHDLLGVPLNLVYAPGRIDHPVVLPRTFSQKVLLSELDKAGPSRVASATGS